ncbi:dihydroxyacetone kinase subunit DhaL [Cypionkella sp.]|uniref:dihydroxyacetone kinase subunit DhaL n=1 Tax=Cypionkella sp. TaxID=2811411 RepID=UPI00261138C0|nr:dihydroxyacetone kinase subunit DhaL [Cypionkella sp.]MDB5663710.1 dihydroxyacetone kinase [Cypionkella sp.]
MDFTTQNLTDLFANLAARMAGERDALCALDGLIGDADHGIAMEQGMQAAAAAVPNLATLQDQFNAAAKAFLNAVGASSGPLYATAFMRAAKTAGPRAAMPGAETPSLITAMAEGIAHRGKAEPGQKTMIDAWHPASEAAKSGATWPEILRAAQSGANATAQMQASLGRAARLGERSLGHKDPGAVSACMIIEEFAKVLS